MTEKNLASELSCLRTFSRFYILIGDFLFMKILMYQEKAVVTGKLSCPILAVKVAVTDGFCQMDGRYLFAVVEICNGSCHFQNTVMRPGT